MTDLVTGSSKWTHYPSSAARPTVTARIAARDETIPLAGSLRVASEIRDEDETHDVRIGKSLNFITLFWGAEET